MRAFSAALLVVFGGLLMGAGDGGREVEPIERFLSVRTRAFLSLPDAKAAFDALGRAGESRAALAARFAKAAGRDAGPMNVALTAFEAAADGPVTWSLHTRSAADPGMLPAFLVTASTTREGDHLKEASRLLIRDVLAPLLAKRVPVENLMGLPVTHLAGHEGIDVYVAMVEGRFVASSSALLLGQLLMEIQVPTGSGLAGRTGFAGARAEAARKAGGPHGFLLVNDPSAVPFAEEIGLTGATGLLVPTEKGVRDELTLTSKEHGLLARLTKDGRVPGVWAGPGDGVWIGASLTPTGVLGLVLTILPDEYAILTMRLDEVAAGPVELLLRPGRAPLLRMELRDGVDPERAVKPMGRLAKRVGSALLVCADKASLAAAPEARTVEIPAGGARLSARLPLLLELLGRAGAPGRAETAWAFVPSGGRAVTVRSGEAEIGPIGTLIASLFR